MQLFRVDDNDTYNTYNTYNYMNGPFAPTKNFAL